MKKLIILCLLVLFLGCQKQNKAEKGKPKGVEPKEYIELVDNKVVYEVINTVLSNKNKDGVYKHCDAVLNRKTIVLLNYDTEFMKAFDTIFNENDKQFIRKQFNNGNWFILDQKLVKDKKVIEFDVAKFNSKEKKEYASVGCAGYLYVPLFNLKKNIAIVECGGLRGGGRYLYKLNKNNKWELYQTIGHYIE